MSTRRLRHLLGLVLLGLVLVSGCALGGAHVLSRSLPEGPQGPAAEALADRLLTAVDAPAWERTGAVQWTFFGNRHLWDRSRNLDRVELGSALVLVDIGAHTGRAFIRGKPITGSRKDKLVEKAWAAWANDSFWLNPAVKVRDEGTERFAVGPDALRVSYRRGGVTPGDSYLFELGPDGLPTGWRMWVKVLPIQGLRWTLADWVTLPTGARIATDHKAGPIHVRIEELSAAETLQGLVGDTDPFAALYQAP